MSKSSLDITFLGEDLCVHCKTEIKDGIKTLNCGHLIHPGCLESVLGSYSDDSITRRVEPVKCPSNSRCLLTFSDIISAQEEGPQYLRLLSKNIFSDIQAGKRSCFSDEIYAFANQCIVLIQFFCQCENDSNGVKGRRSWKTYLRKVRNSNGTGFGGRANWDFTIASRAKSKIAARNNVVDYRVANELKEVLTKLRNFKVSPVYNAPFGKPGDLAVPEISALGYILLENSADKLSVLDILLSLWRNDSLMDILSRLELYMTCLEFLMQLAASEETIMCIFKSPEPLEIGVKSKKRSIPEVSQVLIDSNNNESLYKLLEKVKLQCDVFMKSQSASEDDPGFDASSHFIENLKILYSQLENYATKKNLLNGEAKRTRKFIKQKRDALLNAKYRNLDERKKAYEVAMQDLKFKAIALFDMIHAGVVSHDFYGTAISLKQAVGSNRLRMSRISKEIASLSTSLPVSWGSSIFLRADQDRPDVLVALITGPSGTPYENGAFIFDIWLPGQYPSQPPKVLLKTTGHGKVRFNPNLYASGKVCLSLLGTWSGPGWNPTSTLLQVLVSIQSLILVEDPFYNEPGYERMRNTAKGLEKSRKYNQNIQKQTLRWAICELLSNPNHLFKDVLQAHFILKRDEILEQCQQWCCAKGLAKQIRDGLDSLIGCGSSSKNSDEIAANTEAIETIDVESLEQSEESSHSNQEVVAVENYEIDPSVEAFDMQTLEAEQQSGSGLPEVIFVEEDANDSLFYDDM